MAGSTDIYAWPPDSNLVYSRVSSLSLGLCSLRVLGFVTVPWIEAGSSLGKNSGHLLSQIPEKNKEWTAVTAHGMPTRSLH